MIRRFTTWLGITRSGVLLNAAVLGALMVVAAIVNAAEGDPMDFEDAAEFLGVLSLQVLIPVYLHFALWRFTVPERRWGYYVGGLLLIVFGWPFVFTDTVINFLVEKPELSYAQAATNTFFGIVLATGIRATYRGFASARELRQLRRRQTESELAGLKAQLNPHFLFNTLNNIYGVNLDDSARGSAMLLELADVMRYHFELSSQDRVALVKEIALIRSVVQLEALRLRENTTVRLELPPDEELAGRQVPPLLLVPFVENAFKHGAHPAHDGEIVIRLTISPTHLEFETNNPLYPDRQTVSTGIGIANVRQCLALLYGEDYHLATGEREGKWRTHLRLPLPPSNS